MNASDLIFFKSINSMNTNPLIGEIVLPNSGLGNITEIVRNNINNTPSPSPMEPKKLSNTIFEHQQKITGFKRPPPFENENSSKKQKKETDSDTGKQIISSVLPLNWKPLRRAQIIEGLQKILFNNFAAQYMVNLEPYQIRAFKAFNNHILNNQEPNGYFCLPAAGKAHFMFLQIFAIDLPTLIIVQNTLVVNEIFEGIKKLSPTADVGRFENKNYQETLYSKVLIATYDTLRLDQDKQTPKIDLKRFSLVYFNENLNPLSNKKKSLIQELQITAFIFGLTAIDSLTRWKNGRFSPHHIYGQKICDETLFNITENNVNIEKPSEQEIPVTNESTEICTTVSIPSTQPISSYELLFGPAEKPFNVDETQQELPDFSISTIDLTLTPQSTSSYDLLFGLAKQPLNLQQNPLELPEISISTMGFTPLMIDTNSFLPKSISPYESVGFTAENPIDLETQRPSKQDNLLSSMTSPLISPVSNSGSSIDPKPISAYELLFNSTENS